MNIQGSELSSDSDKPIYQLLIESQSSLYAFVYSLVGQRESAHDILQEANLAILSKANEYDPNRSFLTWAYRFIQLQVLAYRKRQGRDRLLFDSELIGTLANEFSENAGESDVRLDALATCIKELRPSHRDMLKQFYEQGRACGDIADTIGKKVSTVHVAMCRIRKALLQCINRKIATEVRQ